ncbi:MAG TPA: adenylyl-sulfate kinase [Actinomycetota bacterium]|jgi:bifunctional enzyme CysN/CysC|nr:adenylyl-sulfate kinase [Actinomycetota bacterium]HRY08786.1 adenylyl-sulfate kinase [Candidatus Nanopelagicales bacterium]HNE89829.1 adenylyl-sulfate kinase [Actinomycetota bacterium]HNL50635.1 adenylyl-sulfate kinase [Actinomycetota bacterium]HNO14660.1 adenylyl-sulfate kinase [Actinomycetota bacterium]
MKALIRVVVCGSVDDGKSTLLGRLLAETGSIPEDQLESARFTRRPGSTIPLGEVDYSLVTDGLEAEREQGITIDVAYRHLMLPSRRRAILADAPGHEQYTRNMAVAASTADVAILLIDSMRGTKRQTHRHLTVCGLMGVKHVVLAVNKLDGVGYDQGIYNELVAEVSDTARRMEIESVIPVPVSALVGDNVLAHSPNTPWYHGPTLLDALDAAEIPEHIDGEVRLPVQTIIRGKEFRGYGGIVAQGAVRAGQTITVAQSGQQAKIVKLHGLKGIEPFEPEQVITGESATIELDKDIDIARSDLLVTGEPPQLADRFAADIVWMSDQQLAHGRSYTLRCGPLEVPATVTNVRHRLDVTNGNTMAARLLEINDVGRVEIATSRPVTLEAYSESRETGGFILVDRMSGETLAAGLTRFALRRATNVVPHHFEVDREARQVLNGHPAKVLWLTGFSGSGKSTIADAVERKLHSLGIRSFVLDGDNLRSGLNKDLGFTPEDRAENVRRVAEVAHLMYDAGMVVIVALVSPFRADRQAARSLFPEGEFLEAWVDTPIEVAMERDTKGLYAKSKSGNLPNLTGVGQQYEDPESAELHLSGTDPVEQNVDTVLRMLLPDAVD